MRFRYKPRRVALAASAVLSVAAPLAASQAQACDAATFSNRSNPKLRQAVTSLDLARLRDIGPPSVDDPSHSVISISPDGSKIAFQVISPDPLTNRICVAMVVLALKKGGSPTIVDVGSELIRQDLQILGRASSPSGLPAQITPHWSPDGGSIFFLKRMNGSTQIWRGWADGLRSEQVSHDTSDIEDFALDPAGGRLLISTRPGIAVTRSAAERELNAGVRFDKRFSPMSGLVPFVMNPIPLKYAVIDLAGRPVRQATVEEAEKAGIVGSRNVLGAMTSTSGQGSVASIQLRLDQIPPTTRLMIGGASATGPCEIAACKGASAPIWWSSDGRFLRFFRREGWAGSATAIYEWKAGSSFARRLFTTLDNLIDCHPIGSALICLHEGSLTPRRIVRLDLPSGRFQVLFDPNPGFRDFALGKVERLNWRNAFGIESFGDLVYPVGYKPGRRYPLVVVQYETRGFLRGGTGNEVPIQVLAGRGFAVLSTQNPSPWGLAPNAKTADEVDARLMDDFLGRRSILSSIEIAVRGLKERGIVDDRVGIAGLSDGSSTVQFAALNSDLFKAGSVSGCCWEPAQDAVLGESIAAQFARTGWPRLIDDNPSFWDRISIARHPKRVAFPLLMQMSDDEYLGALQSYTALREANRPVDLFVYPGEHHIKWQPAHRLAVYRRNVAWFLYWLTGATPTDGPMLADAERWQMMAERDGKSP